jgi:2-oxoglutarate dehydrogenase E1 component
MFHLLRRQVVRPWRKPLVVLTPKSLLRHPKVVSTFDDVDASGFQRIIPDTSVEPSSVSRVLLCTGKIYYDLLAERDENGREDVAILRVEQLYPLQENHIQAALEPYRPDTDVVWVQEEPENMGAWPYWRMRFCQSLLGTWSLRGIYRHASASPATGSASTHKAEQRELIEAAFA